MKQSKGEEVVLNEAERRISDDEKYSKVFWNFFSNVVSDLKIPN